jgi:hypothetical protein
MQVYWPFHRDECSRNEFADCIEDAEPAFAKWMRKHGKLAVLKDDEVNRLERAAKSSSGPSREEVMRSMYNRLEPKPKCRSFAVLRNPSFQFLQNWFGPPFKHSPARLMSQSTVCFWKIREFEERVLKA